MKSHTWFDRFAILLERLPDDRLILVRDVVDAMVARRRHTRGASYPDLQTALVDTAHLGRARRG